MPPQRRRTDRPNSIAADIAVDERSALAEAEQALLSLADYVYTRTSLKPISKTLFLISRCLCVLKLGRQVASAQGLTREYARLRKTLNRSAPIDDFDFNSVVAECAEHLPYVLQELVRVRRLTQNSDSLGLAFNTLLRGKFEGGEGLGTFLTPEEVVFPMVDILLKAVVADAASVRVDGVPAASVGTDARSRQRGSADAGSVRHGGLFGDICGGTGRFVFAIARRLSQHGWTSAQVAGNARLFDQSAMAVDLAQLNFLFDGMTPSFQRVGDSLTAPEVNALRSRFLLLATNPPFGAGKYRWHPELAASLPQIVLDAIGMRGRGDSADPSLLFLFRNLDLLAPGGALAIVLPDGVLHAPEFRAGLLAYEHACSAELEIRAVVSLPATTFALGGTVAKTSFIIVQKNTAAAPGGMTKEAAPLYVAVAEHVGFLKRGNRRADDPAGNDLTAIAEAFPFRETKYGRTVGPWRDHESLVPARLLHTDSARLHVNRRRTLADLVTLCREPVDETCEERQGSQAETIAVKDADSLGPDAGSVRHVRFHISILDVDETGLIDIIAASRNEPLTRGLACRPGDVLISCLNPILWRVAVVPNLAGTWSCSPEFAVLRPNAGTHPWTFAMALHHPDVMRAVRSMAKGTSSSRQRIPRQCLLEIALPDVAGDMAEYVRWREDGYRNRLREAQAFDAVHQHGVDFQWSLDATLRDRDVS